MTHLWQDESNSWCSYCVDTCLEITKAIQEGNGSIETETTFVPFKLDLKKMTQTNIKTGFSRKIKRAVAGKFPILINLLFAMLATLNILSNLVSP